jgi:Ion channel
MLTDTLMAACLVAITVTIHAAGLGMVLTHVSRFKVRLERRFWPITWLLIRIAWLLIVFHVIEIIIWGLFFWWQKCLPDAASSFYFSGVTYATIGYGDVVLPKGWWLFGPAEGLTGILMCGLSTALFFAVVSKTIFLRIESEEPNRTT